MIKYFRIWLWFHVLMCAEILRVVFFFWSSIDMLLSFYSTSIWTEYLFWEGSEGKNEGEAVDRRQKVEEEEASKSRRSCGSWRKMRKAVSLHQTHQLPLLQRGPAQKLDETRHLTLNTGPTALLAQSVLCVFWISFFSLVFGQKFWDKHSISLLQCMFWPLGSPLCRVWRSSHSKKGS